MAIREVAIPTWRPEDDGDYGRHLAAHVLRRQKWLLLLGVMLGGLLFVAFALVQPRVYSAGGTVFIDKGQLDGQGILSSVPLLGGSVVNLENELLILRSRQIAWPVIERNGLNLEIHDLQAADDTWRNLMQRLGRASAARYPREELFTRLRVSDVHVNPELLTPVSYIFEGTEGGGWSVEGKRGRAGERVVLDHVSFTPVFGPAHEPGMRYQLVAKPNQVALRDYSESLSTSTPAPNVIALTYRYHNPYVCAQVTNSIIEEFLASYERNMQTDFTVVFDFLTQEIDERERRIDELSEELTRYQADFGVYMPSAQGGAAIHALSSLEQQRSGQQVRLINISTVLRNWEQRSPEEIYDSIQAPATELPLEAGLVDRLATQITRLKGELQTKTDLHPDVVSLREGIENQIGLIRDTLETSRRALQTADAELASEIAEQRGLLRRLPEAQSRIFMLESELRVNGDILQNLQRSLTDTQFRQASIEREVRVLDEALPPVKKDAPSIVRNAAFGGLGGFVAVLLFALLAEAANRRIKSLREVRLGAGLPVLGVLPGPKLRGRWVPVERNAALMRRLAAYLQADGRVLGVVHLPEAGSSFELVWGLAGALGQGGRPCLLVDADRLDASLSEALNQPPGTGLTDSAAGNVRPEAVTMRLDEQRALAFLGHGPLDSRQLAHVFAQLREHYGSIIIALPPPLQWNGQEQLGPILSAGVVMSLPQGTMRLEELQEAAGEMLRTAMPLLGTVVTNYSARRDVIGRQELSFVAIHPSGRV